MTEREKRIQHTSGVFEGRSDREVLIELAADVRHIPTQVALEIAQHRNDCAAARLASNGSRNNKRWSADEWRRLLTGIVAVLFAAAVLFAVLQGQSLRETVARLGSDFQTIQKATPPQPSKGQSRALEYTTPTTYLVQPGDWWRNEATTPTFEVVSE